MKTIGIRDLSGDLIKMAAGQGEMLGITNDRLLAGVLMPLSGNTLEHLVDRDLTRIEESIRISEQELAAGEWTSLDDLMSEDRSAQPRRRAPSRVAIRNLSGARLQQAAEAAEVLVVTHGGVAVALLVPVTLQWVEHLIERNLSRIHASIERSEHEIATGKLASLDELLEERQGGLSSQSTVESAAAAPAQPYLFHTHDPEEQLIIGVNIVTDAPDNHRRVIAIAADTSARPLLDPVVIPLPDQDEEKVLAGIIRAVIQLRTTLAPRRKHLIGVGIQIAGHVHDGAVVDSPNVNWHRLPLSNQVKRQLGGIPVVLENNANALALRAQLRRDIDPRETAAVILITNRGVGSGLVLDGKVFKGATGMAGEIGHIQVESSQSVKCRCTRIGCLEGIAAPYAISAVLSQKGFVGDFAAAVEAAKDSTNDLVRRTFSQAGDALGRGMADLITLFNPSTIVLYGPEALVGDHRRFRHHEEEAADTAASLYLRAMDKAITNTSFSSGAEDCERILVRNTDEADGAAAAAACLIQQLPALHTAP
ncbi:ROK family protein [Streptomyces sp. ASQP_92]|uniref:ROK family protein n=1 Tax=Streptomyces sp. ASQP_92 TaxID=2979116 RepID=UPI0021BE6CFB|nr:ROK family protein [Streptomyces sp. ASQP_92]MCT9094164.1 ROK family protein [Streptomyces sp. ASQP_92]